MIITACFAAGCLVGQALLAVFLWRNMRALNQDLRAFLIALETYDVKFERLEKRVKEVEDVVL